MDLESADDEQFINPFKQYYVVVIPEAVVRYRGLSPGAKLVYGRLQRYAGRKGVAFPGVPELAEEVGLGERQTKEYIGELVEQKFIHRQRVFAQGNVYKFLKHACLNGTEIGAPRVNSGSFSNGRDAAQQSNGRDAAPYIGRDAAPQSPLSYEEGHSSGSYPPTPRIKSETQNQRQHPPSESPTLDLEELKRFLPSRFKAIRGWGGFNGQQKKILEEKLGQLSGVSSEQVYAALDAFGRESFWRSYESPARVKAFFTYLSRQDWPDYTDPSREAAAAPVPFSGGGDKENDWPWDREPTYEELFQAVSSFLDRDDHARSRTRYV